MDWQSIESAPKDGTWVILGGGRYSDEYDPPALVAIARWIAFSRGGAGWFVCVADAGHNCFPYEDATHWMPLPSPPSDRSESNG